MSGQKNWLNRGAPYNEFIVNPELERDIYEEATYGTIFAGALNNSREVKVTEIAHSGGTITIDAKNDSPVWQKPVKQGNEVRFTMREENVGLATYGDANVRTGDFARFRHGQCFTRLVDTPAYPIPGLESQEKVRTVLGDLATAEKQAIASWVSKEMDLDAFRALFMGYSRGILSTEDGGLGRPAIGGTAGQARAPFNTYVVGNGQLTATAWNANSHNDSLAAALNQHLGGAATNPQLKVFTYNTHVEIAQLIRDLHLQPVKILGKEYKAVAIIDEWNIASLRMDEEFIRRWMSAAPRAHDNHVLSSLGTLDIDGILYIPATQMSFFRPDVNLGATSGSRITWGVGLGDPRVETIPASNICMTVVMGRGALLRCQRRGDFFITSEVGKHNKGLEIAGHYHDGWARNDWRTEDGREEVSNDSSLVVFNRGVSPIKTIS